jgi:hypothetical protein
VRLSRPWWFLGGDVVAGFLQFIVGLEIWSRGMEMCDGFRLGSRFLMEDDIPLHIYVY